MTTECVEYSTSMVWLRLHMKLPNERLRGLDFGVGLLTPQEPFDEAKKAAITNGEEKLRKDADFIARRGYWWSSVEREGGSDEEGVQLSMSTDRVGCSFGCFAGGWSSHR